MAATVVAPFVGAAVGVAAPLTIDAIFAQRADIASLMSYGFLIAFYVGSVLGLPATIVLGLPVHAALYAFDMRQAWHYAMSGTVPGMSIGSIILAWLSDEPGRLSNLATILAFGAAAGAVTAWAFWLIGRPDRDARANPVSTAP